jgi:hypothetical protein
MAIEIFSELAACVSVQAPGNELLKVPRTQRSSKLDGRDVAGDTFVVSTLNE